MSVPEVNLWCSVLNEGLRDLARGVDRYWLRSRDFETVAWLAGLDPDAVRDAWARGFRGSGGPALRLEDAEPLLARLTAIRETVARVDRWR